VKVGKLKVNKETVKDLAPGEKKQIKGGIFAFTGFCAIKPPPPPPRPSIIEKCPA